MKHYRSLLCLLLCLALLLAMMAGCAKTETAAAEETAPAAEAAETAESAQETAPAAEAAEPAEAAAPAEEAPAEETPAEASAEEAAEPAPAEGEEAAPAEEEAGSTAFTHAAALELAASDEVYHYDLPLAEGETFSIYATSAPEFIQPYLGSEKSYNTSAYNVYLAETVGVSLEFIEIDMFSYSEKFNLMLASGSYTDFFSSLGTYTDIEALEDEVIIDMTEYVENDMPVHWAMVEAAGLIDDMYNDDGQILNVPGISIGGTSPRGLSIRADWLEAEGLEVPGTYDEITEVATALKAAYNLDYAIFLPDSLNPSITFSAGFDTPAFDLTTPGSHLFIRNDQYESCYVTEDFKDYLKLINSWMEQGLLDPDFYTATSSSGKDLFLGSKFAMYWDNPDYITENNTVMAGDAGGFRATGAPVTVKEEGQVLHFSPSQSLSISGGVYVTSVCENLDLAVPFLDWMFSYEGIMMSTYGIEASSPDATDGSYYFDENGDRQWTEFVVNNPDGVGFQSVVATFINTTLPSVSNEYKFNDVIYDEDGRKAAELWTTGYANDGAYDFWDMLTNTNEELETYNQYINDVDTMASTYILKFVLGELDIDATWDEYVDTLYAMGLQEAIDAKQAALDRYLEKNG